MIDFTSDSRHATNLLTIIHIFRSLLVYERLVYLLDVSDFSNMDERPYALLLDVLKATKSSGASDFPMPQPILGLELSRRLEDDPDYLSEEDRKSLQAIVSLIYSYEESDLRPDYVLSEARKFIAERRLRPAVSKLLESTPDELAAKFDVVAKIRESTAIDVGRSANLFMPEAEDFVIPERRDLGFLPVNMILGGGISAGDVVGLLGPSGGGKTTLGVQLSVLGVKVTEMNAAYLSYEVSFDSKIRNRFVGYIGDIPRSVIDPVKSIKDIDPKYLEKFRAEREFYAKRLFLQDMNGRGACSGAADILAFLRDMDAKGKHIDLVVIDQWISMLQRYMAANNMDPTSLRLVSQRVIDELVALSQPSRLNCSFLILHQTTATLKSAPATRKPKQGESAEDKQFDNWIPFCMALGTMDSANRCWIVGTKTREAAPASYIVQMNPDRYRFEYHDGRFIQRGSSFIDTTAVDDSRRVSHGIEVASRFGSRS